MAGQPKPAFYVITGAVVIGLIGLAIYNWSTIAPKSRTKSEDQGAIDPKELQGQAAEQTDASSLLTKKEYTFVPIQRLPAVSGISAYQKMKDNTVRFAINVWAGWAPIIMANEGFHAGKVWKTPDGKEFKVEIDLIDDPVKMRDAYTSGNIHIGWATLDMVPLFLETFVDKNGKPRDTRIMP